MLEIIKYASAVSDKTGSDIEELQHKAASLYQENKKLRTELQIFQDHLERSEVKAVELEIQVEHLKFMNTLPAECEVRTIFKLSSVAKKCECSKC